MIAKAPGSKAIITPHERSLFLSAAYAAVTPAPTPAIINVTPHAGSISRSHSGVSILPKMATSGMLMMKPTEKASANHIAALPASVTGSSDGLLTGSWSLPSSIIACDTGITPATTVGRHV